MFVAQIGSTMQTSAMMAIIVLVSFVCQGLLFLSLIVKLIIVHISLSSLYVQLRMPIVCTDSIVLFSLTVHIYK